MRLAVASHGLGAERQLALCSVINESQAMAPAPVRSALVRTCTLRPRLDRARLDRARQLCVAELSRTRIKAASLRSAAPGAAPGSALGGPPGARRAARAAGHPSAIPSGRTAECQ